MPLFRCSKCGCIENTALSNYIHVITEKESPLCSECDPNIGKWHGRFQKKSAKGLLIGSDGFLYGPQARESESIKWRMEHQGFRFVGEVTA